MTESCYSHMKVLNTQQLKNKTETQSHKKKSKGTVYPVHTTKAYREREVQVHSYLTSALNGGESLVDVDFQSVPYQ
jgi:hypothetical protein